MQKANFMMSLLIPYIFTSKLFRKNTFETKTAQWKSYSNIAVDKEWTIIFNHNLVADFISTTVNLLDSNNEKINIMTSISGNTLNVIPISNLKYSSKYKIVVTNSLNATKGKAMNQTIVIPFSTASKNISTPVKTFSSEYDLIWTMPSTDYHQFNLIGIKDDEQVAGYETRKGQNVFGIHIGGSREDVREKFGAPLSAITKNNTNFKQYYDDKYNEETSGTYLIDDQYVTFLYDAHKNFKVRSAMWVGAHSEISKEGFFAVPSLALRNGFEDLMMELINEARVAEGLQPLIYTPEYNIIARRHSMNMANHRFFDHVDLQGLRGGARMKNGGMTFDWWGENLAFGQYSAIHAHEALMNSITHRENILREQFTHAFVGVEFSNQNRPYFTINFYSI